MIHAEHYIPTMDVSSLSSQQKDESQIWAEHGQPTQSTKQRPMYLTRGYLLTVKFHHLEK